MHEHEFALPQSFACVWFSGCCATSTYMHSPTRPFTRSTRKLKPFDASSSRDLNLLRDLAAFVSGGSDYL